MVDIVAGQQTASMEDYLEAVALLKKEGKPVTVTRISKAMDVKKPTVYSAITKLSKAGLVLHEKYGDVDLTAEGAKMAQDVYKRHQILRQFLIDVLSVDPNAAEKDACRLEHVLSRASLSKLEKFVVYLVSCPRGDPKCLSGFNYFAEHGKRDPALVDRCQNMDRMGE
jgi:DtxR family Mn-dependent transcriptional regulator